ncbi:MAG: acyl-CoA dehydrogenase family protein, partial [Pseudomonadota bacterium]
MRLVKTYGPPKLMPLGLDLTLTAEEEALRAGLQTFAEGVMEPICKRLDRIDAGDMVVEKSEWWSLLSAFMELGIDVDSIYLSDDKIAGNRLKSIAFEELGCGDSGFATGIMVAFFPYVMAGLLKRPDLMELARGKIGCWVATQRVRGSDVGDVDGAILHPGSQHERPELYAEIKDGAVVLNGRSSPWVSFGPVADLALAYVPLFVNGAADYREDGTLTAIAVMVPLDRPGASKGPPLDKLGQRPLPQGSIVFDNVSVPTDFIVAQPEDYQGSFTAALIEGNQTLGAVFTGLARLCLEHALAYAHERRQG